ncbi:MAG: M23 family metallopeptidase [Azoarcus sp.]|nr:M23 family metallopeptidase [Azoarcus sp.]
MSAFINGTNVFGFLNNSVGLGGVNRPEDVEVVQRLLNAKGCYGKECRFDNVCGLYTIQGIKKFQSIYVMWNPNGLILPGSWTWQQLVHPTPLPIVGRQACANALKFVPPVPASAAAPDIVYFPVAHSKLVDAHDSWYTPPSQKIYCAARSWNPATQRYGRVHAGVDIYTKEHAEVYACAAGKVVEYAQFPMGKDGIRTIAIAIEHENTHVGRIIVRYGELDPRTVPEDLKTVGSIIAARMVIGKTWPVAKSGGSYPYMLHLETYNGTATGALTRSGDGELVNIRYKGQNTSQTQAKTSRRADLIDPYPFLIGCIINSAE